MVSRVPCPSTLIRSYSKGHISNYYLGQLTTKDEVDAIQAAAEKLGIDILNTRVRKNGPSDFTLLIASADKKTDIKEETLSINGQTATLKIEYGDHSEALRKAADALKKAKEYAANDHQASALECYIRSFETGDIEAHKEASRAEMARISIFHSPVSHRGHDTGSGTSDRLSRVTSASSRPMSILLVVVQNGKDLPRS
jgi:dipeptidyl-peptidase-3